MTWPKIYHGLWWLVSRSRPLLQKSLRVEDLSSTIFLMSKKEKFKTHNKFVLWKIENQISKNMKWKFILGNCDSHLKLLQRTLGISSCTRHNDNTTHQTRHLLCATNMSGFLQKNIMQIKKLLVHLIIVEGYF